MVQNILVVLLFLGAMAYLSNLLFKQFKGTSGCASGCNKCATVDFKKIEQQIEKQG